MIDIHAHILPGIDDGAEDFDEALAMAEMAVSCGITCMAATPHWQVSETGNYQEKKNACQQMLRQLRSAVLKTGIPLQLVSGMEILGCGDLADSIYEEKMMSLNHSGCYLVEFPFDMEPDEMRYCWKSVTHGGGQPVIAHPERYFCIQDAPWLLYDWMREGVYTQINRGSLLGRFGDEAEKTSHLLLACNLATCVASDAHHSYMRTPYMKDICRLLRTWYPEGEEQRLLSVNPCRILLGEPVLAGRVRYPGTRSVTVW